ncbi:hypothetical protein RCM09_08540 [Escherichia marmotae]|uniref:YidX family protein n=1 Tax=Escherichia TaxID=561 RepID=UPI000CF766D9|nr:MULTISPECIES: hypothetical protein [Escherichia]EFN9755644.1 hypothetical protein [Escherichia coli]EFO1628455.1 hypothetical protein [Escherichia coli]MBB2416249.1 hypothetical protein [Escherichia sp. 11.1596]MBB2420040.1 hypothetical protein [Escherichia sp. 12.2610]MBB2423859.1 hypothetical protein [Escherichia sp. 11.1597]
MQLNFQGFIKAACLCSLAFALTGCLTAGLLFNTASPPHAEQWRSDSIKGLSLAKDSNGTKGYVFVGESLDYLLTTGGGEVVKMLNDPAIHGEKITVSDNVKFILSSGDTNFSGAITLYYDWDNEEDKALATQYGFVCDTQRCTWMLDGLKGSIHQKNKKADYSNMMVFHQPFTVGFYAYKATDGVPRGLANALLPVTLTLDIVTSPLQFLILCTTRNC